MPETSCLESLSSGFKPRTVSAAMTASEKKPPVARVAKTALKRKPSKSYGDFICVKDVTPLCIFHRLQNSPYFCVFKYARAVKQKVWNEAENRERDWGETLKNTQKKILY